MTKNKNTSLHTAKVSKSDEFYTTLADIENEIRNYIDFFKGKSVYCNCDDYRKSNFFRYFVDNYHELGLSGLVATCYKMRSVDLLNPTESEPSLCAEYDGVEVKVTELQGDGDFRSNECVRFLKHADVVVTNPPFSLFREYIAQLMGHEKKFLIIGNMNAVTYKEIFPYIKDNKLWYGPSISSGDRKFYVPDDYPLNAAGCGIDEDGKRYIRVKGVRWFTNIPHASIGNQLVLEKHYTPEEYPKYDNYDAIEVSKVTDIPVDYYGVMGVPITFLDKWCPDQFGADFEIVGWSRHNDEDMDGGYWQGGKADAAINGKEVYRRILIRRKDKDSRSE